MVPISPLGLLLWFLSGMATMLVLLLTWPTRKKARPSGRVWAKIDEIKWHWDFDYAFTQPTPVNDLAKMTAYMMSAQIDKRPLPDAVVTPGSYTIRINVQASFICREQFEGKKS